MLIHVLYLYSIHIKWENTKKSSGQTNLGKNWTPCTDIPQGDGVGAHI